jgi:Spy/CpxP family protein refolding chaperone
VDLTDAQRAQIRDVLVSRRPQVAETVKSVREKRVALRNAVLNPQSSESDIRAAADKLGDVIADAAVKAAKLRGELAPILTEAQRQTIAEFIAEHDDTVTKFLEKAGKSE